MAKLSATDIYGNLKVNGNTSISGVATQDTAATAATHLIRKGEVDGYISTLNSTIGNYLPLTGGILSGNLTVGSATSSTNTVVKALAGDLKLVGFEALGSEQGTAYLYLGQNTTLGGGIMYNGDDNPNVVQTQDAVSFYRRTDGTDVEVFRYHYNSSIVHFTSNINIGGIATQTEAATDATHLMRKGEMESAISTSVGNYLPLTGGILSGNLTISETGSNQAAIKLDISNSGSPQINFSDNVTSGGDMYWAIGADDNDNSFKIHGTRTATPTIVGFSRPLVEITTAGDILNNGNVSTEGLIITDTSGVGKYKIVYNSTDDSLETIKL